MELDPDYTDNIDNINNIDIDIDINTNMGMMESESMLRARHDEVSRAKALCEAEQRRIQAQLESMTTQRPHLASRPLPATTTTYTATMAVTPTSTATTNNTEPYNTDQFLELPTDDDQGGPMFEVRDSKPISEQWVRGNNRAIRFNVPGYEWMFDAAPVSSPSPSVAMASATSATTTAPHPMFAPAYVPASTTTTLAPSPPSSLAHAPSAGGIGSHPDIQDRYVLSALPLQYRADSDKWYIPDCVRTYSSLRGTVDASSAELKVKFEGRCSSACPHRTNKKQHRIQLFFWLQRNGAPVGDCVRGITVGHIFANRGKSEDRVKDRNPEPVGEVKPLASALQALFNEAPVWSMSVPFVYLHKRQQQQQQHTPLQQQQHTPQTLPQHHNAS